jgi:hypothetical protein
LEGSAECFFENAVSNNAEVCGVSFDRSKEFKSPLAGVYSWREQRPFTLEDLQQVVQQFRVAVKDSKHWREGVIVLIQDVPYSLVNVCRARL